ncbi:unnamed protein product [Darwinula stevensoni]|uniref:Headcase protein n=1 Tax=Darwinula stevensoni TaxID=69355 RepID=A0A7R8WZN1_9CRUS|nr:unnamed protein product [Darwinula stevensoni]CAG0880744.1 unnamed protein product [Darwinula stevensoni]
MPNRRVNQLQPEVHFEEVMENHDAESVECCVPTGCTLKDPIHLADLTDARKVLCNNEQCTTSGFMHSACFEAWEAGVLAFLKSCGRARSWSEKQRHQNLWTKKGYDLAFKACGCRCGRGHLRKDLDWIPPKPQNVLQPEQQKRKKKHKQNALPILGLGFPQPQLHHSGSPPKNGNGNMEPIRARTNSMSSTGSTGSPSSGNSSNAESPSPIHAPSNVRRKSGSGANFDFFAERTRHGSGTNGIFSRRLDFRSFNVLPRHKINSYHIKMEEEGSAGDEIRCFILSTLAASRTGKVNCTLCFSGMPVFDRYPLVDGTFFLSPTHHSPASLPVKIDGREQYLSAICMSCLEGWGSRVVCKGCRRPWDGSQLILGSMYSFDVFAANPCCSARLQCNNCSQLVLHPEQRLAFFSDYSRSAPCPFCGLLDHHFIKPLHKVYDILTLQQQQQPKHHLIRT